MTVEIDPNHLTRHMILMMDIDSKSMFLRKGPLFLNIFIDKRLSVVFSEIIRQSFTKDSTHVLNLSTRLDTHFFIHSVMRLPTKRLIR